jgi:hypothetical protein
MLSNDIYAGNNFQLGAVFSLQALWVDRAA